MKQIKKGKEPDSLVAHRQNSHSTYDNYKQKADLRDSLTKEQGYICCYCERELIATDSHIEHLLPQEKYPEKALDFSNLLCSCQKDIKRGEPRHCGNLKDNYEIPISPLDADCEKYFTYTYDGNIKPIDEKFEITINKLGLDIPKLIDLRKKAIEPFIDDSLTEEELIKFISKYLEKIDEKYSPFHATIKHLKPFLVC